FLFNGHFPPRPTTNGPRQDRHPSQESLALKGSPAVGHRAFGLPQTTTWHLAISRTRRIGGWPTPRKSGCVYAFVPVWPSLANVARLVAVDFPASVDQSAGTTACRLARCARGSYRNRMSSHGTLAAGHCGISIRERHRRPGDRSPAPPIGGIMSSATT